MKKLIYFTLVPVFLFAQVDFKQIGLSNIHFGLRSSFQKDFVISNYFNSETEYNKLRSSIGFNLGYKFPSKNIKCGLELQWFINPKYKSINNVFFPEFAGVASPNALGVLEIIGAHEAYTLTEAYQVEQPRLLSFYFSLDVIENLSISLNTYFSKLSFASQNQTYGPTSGYELIGGVVTPFVVDEVQTERQEGDMGDYGINLGLTYEYNKFIFDFRIPLYSLIFIDGYVQEFNGSQKSLKGSQNINKSLIFSIGYTIL